MAQDKAQSTKSQAKASGQPKKKKGGPLTFMREVRAEAGKVTWASRAETIQATIMVVVMTVLVSLFLLIVDQLVGGGIRLITGIDPSN